MELPKVENGTWYANGGLILKNCSTRIFVGFDIFHSPQPPTDGTIFVFNLNGTSFPEPDFALTPVLWPQPNFMLIFLYVYKCVCFATSFRIKVSKYIVWVKYFSKFAFPDFGVYFGGYHRFVVVPLTAPSLPLRIPPKKGCKDLTPKSKGPVDFFHIKKRMFVPKSKDQSRKWHSQAEGNRMWIFVNDCHIEKSEFGCLKKDSKRKTFVKIHLADIYW